MSSNMEIKEINGNKSIGPLQPSSPPVAAMQAATNSQYPYCYLNQSIPQNSNYFANNNTNNYQSFNNNLYWNNNNYQQQQHYNYQQNFNYYHQYHQNVNNNNNSQMMQQQYYQKNQFKPHHNNDNNRNYQKNNYSPNNPNNFQHKNKNNHGNFQKNNAHNQHNNYNNNNNRGKNKKIKIDKRDLPENNAFYCEVCDRGFKTDDKYKEHCNTHTTCNVNGCKFTAAARLVEIHFENFHATGLDKKVSSLQTEEEIAKYRNERKKNFPSLGNLEKRSKLENEKEARGVRLNTQQYGKLKVNKCENNSNLAKTVDQVSQISESVAAKEIPKHLSRNMKRKISKRNKNKKKSSLFDRKAEVLRNKYKKPTLLQKLLAEEIRHERNILLQCIKYIVENNFFDKKKQDTSATNLVILNNNDKAHTSKQNSDLSEELKL